MANYSTCCRLCLSEKPDTIKSVFDDAFDDRLLPQKILSSVAIQITSGDKVTTMICIDCVEKVNGYYAFKQSCSENQNKLEQWLQMNTSDVPELSMNIHIKEEPMDEPEPEPEPEIDNDPDPGPDLDDPPDEQEECVMVNGNIIPVIKNEPLEEEFHELPMNQSEVENHDELLQTRADSQNENDNEPNPRQCTVCDKLFSSAANRKKHERVIHGIDHKALSESISQDEKSQSSMDSQTNGSELLDTEERKILFAAGLKLLQTNSTPLISQESLSKIELSYMEKCKAMAQMYNSLICACHNVSHPNLKGMLSHLRSIRIWFPVFTCYHCMITFTDRPSYSRHQMRCNKHNLETLVKLSNLKKRSEVKTRLYQNYKCRKCKFMYSFHEDFCTHVDEEHSDIRLPTKCSCGREFDTIEDYKDHAYVSCLVEFYCDICFVTVKTLDAFQKHASEVHDQSEGFVLLQDDNYRQKKERERLSLPETTTRTVKREHSEENIVTGKRERRSTFYKERYDTFDDDSKVINPIYLRKIPGTVCPICSREYATNNNMLRHYKSHAMDSVDERGKYDESLYCCPDCGGMFSAKQWEKHKETHAKKSCGECGKVFQFQSELDQHRSVHLNLKVYRDSKTQAYRSTMASPNSDSKIVVMCEICDDIFPSKDDLRQHKANVHDMMTDSDRMSQADSQTNSLDSTLDDDEDYVGGTNTKSRKFRCNICNKHYATYGGLWEHNRKLHPENKSPYSKDFPKQCKYCDKVFYTGGSLVAHVQMHERNRDNIANIQRNRLSSPDSSSLGGLEEDNNDDDTESYHTCKKCFKVFASRYNLKNHMKSHGIILSSSGQKSLKTKGKKVWCDVCHEAFDSASNLEEHKMEEHGESSEKPSISDEGEEFEDVKGPFVFTCNVCVQTFTTKLALKRHKEKHAQERQYMQQPTRGIYCKYCKGVFPNTEQLSYHVKKDHAAERAKEVKKSPFKKSDKWICSICQRPFNSSAALYAHQGWHKRGKIFEQYNESNNTQQNQNQMNLDIRDVREPAVQLTIKQEKLDVSDMAADFQCNTCGIIFPNDTALQIHILEKHRNVNAIVLTTKCNMCSLDFTSKEEYERHKQFHHMIEPQRKTFPCNHCPAAFTRLENLNAHLKQCHSNQIKAEYNCPQCNKVFDKQLALTAHLKVHEKQRQITHSKPLFSCSICNLGFNLPKDLRAHTIQAHPF